MFQSIDDVWEQNKDDMVKSANETTKDKVFNRFKKRVRDLTGASMSEEEVDHWRKVFEDAIATKTPKRKK